MPDLPAPPGWQWRPLAEVARLESGHTPSRKHPEYWNGDIPWVGIKDAKQNHGCTVSDTEQHVTQQGIDNSSARVLPAGTVCLSRTASIGYVLILGRPMATSQDFANWICSDELDSRFLAYLFLAEKNSLSRFSSGAIHQTIYYPELKAFHVCIPDIAEQRRIVSALFNAFARIDQAVLNAQSNLHSARELYLTALSDCFDQQKPAPPLVRNAEQSDAKETSRQERAKTSAASTTRGRAATDRIIPGDFSLSVGKPPVIPRPGWKWTSLTDLARLESGHTPSRRHPEYWNGEVPWIGIRDAKASHGKTIHSTEQYTNELGLQHSAARLLPKNTVCLSRTASVGYVVVMGTDMATSQDFVNWICTEQIEPRFLQYLLLAQGRDFFRFSRGAVHQTIYFTEAKAFHVCHPAVEDQRNVIAYLDTCRTQSERLEKIYQRKCDALAELRNSILQEAFLGRLFPTASAKKEAVA